MKLFNWFKSILNFNISRNELPKFLALSGIMFCVLFNYTVLRDIKDVIIIGSAGAEVIPYIKGIFVLIVTVLFMIFYGILVSFLGERKTFYFITVFFLSFFALFCFYLYPNAHLFHPSIDSINKFFAKYKFLVWIRYILNEQIFANWLYVLFYTFAELWGTACLSVLFWQFTNEIVVLNEANRFYPIFGIISNLGLIASGKSIKYLVHKNSQPYKYINPEDYVNYDQGITKITHELAPQFQGNMFFNNMMKVIEKKGDKAQLNELVNSFSDQLQWRDSLPELSVLMIIIGALMLFFHRLSLSISAVEVDNYNNKKEKTLKKNDNELESDNDSSVVENNDSSVSFSKIMYKFFSIPFSGVKSEVLHESSVKKTKKKKMGLFQSLKFLLSSNYLLCIFLLVICYGISINMFEIVWKGKIKELFGGSPSKQAMFQANISEKTGMFVILFILFTKNIFSQMSWFVRAIITPSVMAVTGFFFFVFVLFKDTEFINSIVTSYNLNPLYIAVLFGGIQSVLTKGCKYSMFDPTKEVLYMLLDPKDKTNAKAAVDGAGGRISKACGSYIWLGLFIIGKAIYGIQPDISFFIPIVSVIIGTIIFLWFFSVGTLYRTYSEFEKKQK